MGIGAENVSDAGTGDAQPLRVLDQIETLRSESAGIIGIGKSRIIGNDRITRSDLALKKIIDTTAVAGAVFDYRSIDEIYGAARIDAAAIEKGAVLGDRGV